MGGKGLLCLRLFAHIDLFTLQGLIAKGRLGAGESEEEKISKLGPPGAAK